MIKLLIFMFFLNFLILFLNVEFLMLILINILFIIIFILILNRILLREWFLIYNFFSMDSIRILMVFLRILVIALIFIVRLSFYNLKFYRFVLLILLSFLFLRFTRINYFLFYLFFEASLIPTFILIIGWGYQPERLIARISLLFYTLFASLPLLILLFYLFDYFNSLNFLILISNYIFLDINRIIFYFYMIFAFLVKLPIFGFHLWLPKAHIEAPLTGSIILAAIILKLGGYGLYRRLTFIINYRNNYNYFFFIIRLFGLIYLRLLCLRCNDFKLIVAYSSVVHIGIILISLLTLRTLGFLGGILIMLGHGICSSALFLLINLCYERTMRRSLILNKGIINIIPTLSMWWFLFCIINISAPISLNLFSEILILISLISWSLIIIIILMLGIYFSSIYRLYLFSYSQHGIYRNLILKFKINKVNDYLCLIIHWIPLNFLIFKMELFYYLNSLIKILICGISDIHICILDTLMDRYFIILFKRNFFYNF